MRKTKLIFMIYADFERTLIPENNGKQNPDKFYTNRYQNYAGYSFGYKLVCVDDQFSKPFKPYLGQHAVYRFITKKVNIVVV